MLRDVQSIYVCVYLRRPSPRRGAGGLPTCNNNIGTGIFLGYANGSLVEHNTCNDNGGSGILVVGSRDCKIRKNSCNEHREGGIYLAKDCKNNEVLDNDAKLVYESKGGNGDSPGFGLAGLFPALVLVVSLEYSSSRKRTK